MALRLLAVAALSAPPAPIDLSSGSCTACWTARSAEGEGSIGDGHGAVEVPALVPGEVHDDLMRGGVLGDLWYGNGSTLADAAWVGWRTWHFSRSFPTPPAAALRRWLRFAGVQYNCTVALNNETLGAHVGQFEPFEFDVTTLLRPDAGRARLLGDRW